MICDKCGYQIKESDCESCRKKIQYYKCDICRNYVINTKYRGVIDGKEL